MLVIIPSIYIFQIVEYTTLQYIGNIQVSDTPHLQTASLQLGRIIQALRKDNNITGAQLGSRAGLSQSKISKIEHGRLPLPAWDVIENILTILNATQQIRQQVQLLEAQLQDVHSAYGPYHFTAAEVNFRELESQAKSLQSYSNTVLPMQVQTSAYRLACLQLIYPHGADLRAIMKESLLRQDLLWNAAIRHYLLMNEVVLYTIVTSTRVHLTQLDRLERLVGIDGCEIGIIPTKAGLPVLEVSSFTLYDATRLCFSIGTSETMINSPGTVAQFVQVFGELSQKAYYGSEAITLIREAIDYFNGKQIDL